jgi:hypothetical protein
MKIRKEKDGTVIIIDGGDLSHIKFRYLEELTITKKEKIYERYDYSNTTIFKGKLCNIKKLVVCNTIIKPITILEYLYVGYSNIIDCDYKELDVFKSNSSYFKISKYCITGDIDRSKIRINKDASTEFRFEQCHKIKQSKIIPDCYGTSIKDFSYIYYGPYAGYKNKFLARTSCMIPRQYN